MDLAMIYLYSTIGDFAPFYLTVGTEITSVEDFEIQFDICRGEYINGDGNKVRPAIGDMEGCFFSGITIDSFKFKANGKDYNLEVSYVDATILYDDEGNLRERIELDEPYFGDFE